MCSGKFTEQLYEKWEAKGKEIISSGLSCLCTAELAECTEPTSLRVSGETSALNSVINAGVRSPAPPMFGIEEECWA